MMTIDMLRSNDCLKKLKNCIPIIIWKERVKMPFENVSILKYDLQVR